MFLLYIYDIIVINVKVWLACLNYWNGTLDADVSTKQWASEAQMFQNVALKGGSKRQRHMTTAKHSFRVGVVA